jgi:hypothetical protein
MTANMDDGGLPRAEAEARAFACCVVEWLNRNFMCSPPARCLACGGRDHARDALLPHGIEPIGGTGDQAGRHSFVSSEADASRNRLPAPHPYRSS